MRNSYDLSLIELGGGHILRVIPVGHNSVVELNFYIRSPKIGFSKKKYTYNITRLIDGSMETS